MPDGALTSYTLCEAYRYFVGQTSITSQSWSRTEYFLPTDNILLSD